MIDIICEAKKLLGRLDMGHMGGVAYDTACVARLKDSNGTPLFPRSLSWLLANQKVDGSWGSEIEYYHDRVISTLASIVTLAKHGIEIYKREIKMGENYIWECIPKLQMDPYETIGFELIFPTAMRDAKKYGLNLPYSNEQVTKYDKIREKKLSKIPVEMLYSQKASSSYSMEFLGDELDETKIKKVQLSNGSLGDSPSATAFMLSHMLDENGTGYLQKTMSLNYDGSVPSQYPYEIFEKAWVIYNFFNTKIRINDYRPHIDYLEKKWKSTGVSWADSFPVPDSDDSALVFKVLGMFGIKKDPVLFERYEKDDFFICYEFEMNPSISANIHILDAIKDCNDYPRQSVVIEKILRFLKSVRIDGTYWQDKWHTSPYYATAHAIIAIDDLDRSLTESAIDWLIKNQNPNGSWGGYGGNIEDTCLAIQSLLFYHNKIDHLDINTITNGISWIMNGWNGSMPQLWIAKGLYNPINIVRSLVVSVIYYFENTIKNAIVIPTEPNVNEVMI